MSYKTTLRLYLYYPRLMKLGEECLTNFCKEMERCNCLVYGLGVVDMHHTINNTDSDVYL